MSLLLLLNAEDDVPNTLDCDIDAFSVGVEIEIEPLTGIRAVLPAIDATAQITGYSVAEVTVNIPSVDCAVEIRMVGIMDCVATIPRITADMGAAVLPWAAVSATIPRIVAEAALHREGAGMEVLATLPSVSAECLIYSADPFGFGNESDTVLKFESRRRFI